MRHLRLAATADELSIAICSDDVVCRYRGAAETRIGNVAICGKARRSLR